MFNTLLKELRAKNGMTQGQLAKAAGVSPGNVGDWESGKSKPGYNALASLARIFDVSADYLLELSPEKRASRRRSSVTWTRSRRPRGSPVTASRCPRTRWISSPCTGSFLRPIGRRSSTSFTSSTSATSRRKKNLFTRHISTGARTKKAAPLGAVRPATEPPNFFVLP